MPEIFTIIIFAISTAIISFVSYKLGSSLSNLKWQKNLVKLRADIAEKQRAGIKGKVTEAFAPFLEGFPFKPSECKFLGNPIDYLVFEGLDEREVKGVHLLEVKDNKSKLSKHQRQIKEIIDKLDSDEVTFRTFNFKQD